MGDVNISSDWFEWKPEEFEEYEDEENDPSKIPEIEDPVDLTGKIIDQQPSYDLIISLVVQLQLGDELSTGKVKR